MALKEYMKKRHLSGKKSELCDHEGNMKEEKKMPAKKMAKKDKKRSYLDV